MLVDLIEDRRLAWDRQTLRWGDLVVRFSDPALAQLARVTERYGETADRQLAPEEVSDVRAELARFSDSHLFAPGLFIVSGLEGALPPDRWKAALRVMVRCLGSFYLQDGRALEVKEVRDRGLTLDDANARYSDGKHGGALHTDGAERGLPVPDLFALTCVSQGKSGGLFQVLSAYALHNRLLELHPGLVSRLWKPFAFDLRGDVDADGRRFALKPIFFSDPHNAHRLGVSYLRKYVNAAQAYPEAPRLTREDEAALDALDALLEQPDSPLVAEGQMEPGQTAVVNNTMIIHGRSAFEDGPGQTRLLYRSWISTRR